MKLIEATSVLGHKMWLSKRPRMSTVMGEEAPACTFTNRKEKAQVFSNAENVDDILAQVHTCHPEAKVVKI